MKRSLGVLCILAGIGVFGYWIDRSFFHPTHADRQRMATIADTGSDPGDSRKIFVFAGLALLASGSNLVKSARS